jgi:hypothetical protein
MIRSRAMSLHAEVTMKRATHLAALRMASKVALSASVLSCTGGSSAPIAATPSNESIPDTGAKPAEPLTCSEVINRAFPKEGAYPPVTQTASPEVTSCCKQVLLAHMGSAPHRWDCCGVVDRTESNHLSAACTPWGPPTPPAAHVTETVPRGLLDLRGHSAPIALPLLADLRDAAIETWRGRMVNEYASSSVFAALADQLDAAGLDGSQPREFSGEERRHGALCGAVVESLGGEAIGQLPDAHEFPLHSDAQTPIEAALRNVLSICCLSETVAVALIGAERLEMPEGPLRDLLTGIWSDEVGHARFGWRLLAELAPRLDHATRARLSEYLEIALAHLVEHELAHLPLASRPPAEGAVYGLCNGNDARRLFFDTLDTVIIPRLEALGLRARHPWGARAPAVVS